MAEPPLPETVSAGDLDGTARAELRGLQKDIADSVARHLVAAGLLVDEEPQLALQHARYARRKASRVAVVREAAGIAAYHAGEWAEALADLRAARRMGGGPGHLPVMADIERALGRPERSIDLARGPEVRELGQEAQVELAIVAAGARRDLGEHAAAVVALQIPELEVGRRDPWSARLFYAYADNLLAAGRTSDAAQWFVHASDVDDEGETDADRRLADLTGEPWEDDEAAIEFAVEDGAVEAGDVEDGAEGADGAVEGGAVEDGGPDAASERDAPAADDPSPDAVSTDAVSTDDPATDDPATDDDVSMAGAALGIDTGQADDQAEAGAASPGTPGSADAGDGTGVEPAVTRQAGAADDGGRPADADHPVDAGAAAPDLPAAEVPGR